MRIRIHPASPKGAVTVPPSKSASHRAIFCAALAKGKSRLQNIGFSQDIEATLDAVKELGARVERIGDCLEIEGFGGVLPGRELSVHCRESGSTLRFLVPLLALNQEPARLTGTEKLLSRPMDVYRELFEKQKLSYRQTSREITVGGRLRPAVFPVNGAVSSQFITGLLFALPLLEGDSAIRILPPFESRPYVDMTVEMLRRFGVRVDFDSLVLRVPGKQEYRPQSLSVEGDYSQMAFFAVLGTLRGETVCHGLPPKTCQGDSVILDILRRFGAQPEQLADGWRFREARLSGGNVDIADCPDLGPILTVLAAFSKGEVRLLHAGRLRMKECDRAAAMEEELGRLGVRVTGAEDTLRVVGGRPRWSPDTVVNCHNDHRIAMSLAVAGACGELPLLLDGAECVTKSYPGFFEDLSALGVGVEKIGE